MRFRAAREFVCLFALSASIGLLFRLDGPVAALPRLFLPLSAFLSAAPCAALHARARQAVLAAVIGAAALDPHALGLGCACVRSRV